MAGFIDKIRDGSKPLQKLKRPSCWIIFEKVVKIPTFFLLVWILVPTTLKGVVKIVFIEAACIPRTNY